MFLNKAWINKNNKCATYTHFDYRICLSDVLDNITNEKYIETHAFKPFLRIHKETIKYNKDKGRKIKTREINYASHYDRCIYQYYSLMIDSAYNRYARMKGINNIAIAYRSNLHKNNVHFAKKAFDYIKNNPGCIVFVGDFTNFFDTLDHKYLKSKLLNVLAKEELPLHIYKVLKSITRYSFVDYNELKKTLDENNIKQGKRIIVPMNILRQYKHLIRKNEKYGVPQGVSLSAILSNVYMIDFDKKSMELANKHNGLYLRYSDDFIFIFPKKEIYEVNKLYELIIDEVKKIPNLTLSKEKTKIYYCNSNYVKSCEREIGNIENSKNSIDYLGFTYDGRKVSIRDKTIGKYYYRMYSKIDTINYRKSKNLNGCGKRNLYLNYSNKGTKEKMNFFTYVQRCIDVFGKEENVHHVLNTHYGKIRKRLNNKKEGRC